MQKNGWAPKELWSYKCGEIMHVKYSWCGSAQEREGLSDIVTAARSLFASPAASGQERVVIFRKLVRCLNLETSIKIQTFLELVLNFFVYGGIMGNIRQVLHKQ